MSAFRGYPELTVEVGQVDGLHRIVTKSGEVVIAGSFRNEEDAQRLVDCWNACRRLFAPANHITATDEYVARLESLRKEAWARAETAERALEVSQ
jgi:hypothetical protein